MLCIRCASRRVFTQTDHPAEPITRKRNGADLPRVGTACLQKDLQGGASAKSQVISKNGILFIKQVDLELYKATGKVKRKLVPFKSADFYADEGELPKLTPEHEALLRDWNFFLTYERKEDRRVEGEMGVIEYELIRAEALTTARQSPDFNRWQLDRTKWSVKKEGQPPTPRDDNCAWLARLELMRPWFTQPGYSIIWQDKWGNLSGNVKGENKQWATQRPRPETEGLVKGIEVETAKGSRTAEKEKLDEIIIRQLIGELSSAQAAKLEGVTTQKMKDIMKQRIFVLKRTAIESCGRGELKALKAAVRNTYSGKGSSRRIPHHVSDAEDQDPRLRPEAVNNADAG